MLDHVVALKGQEPNLTYHDLDLLGSAGDLVLTNLLPGCSVATRVSRHVDLVTPIRSARQSRHDGGHSLPGQCCTGRCVRRMTYAGQSSAGRCTEQGCETDCALPRNGTWRALAHTHADSFDA